MTSVRSASFTVVIVDDEPLAREKVARLLAGKERFAVVGTAGDGVEAVKAIEELRPDVVFLDVQMPEVDGFQVLDALEGPQPAVVFVTAHDQHAVRAFEESALDYLLKPVEPDRFDATLRRLESRLVAPSHEATAEGRGERAASDLPRPVEHLLVRRGRRLLVVPVAEVELLEAEGNYVTVHTADRSHSLRTSLTRLQERLPPGDFVRIHRSRLLRLAAVAEMEPAGHGDLEVRLRSGRITRWSRRYRRQAGSLFEG